MSEKLKKLNPVDSPLRKLRFSKWASPKMQLIVKEAGPGSQLFVTVNFAFMKIFYFSLKTTIFGAILLFLGDLCHKLWPKIELGG